jgi:hypothetical protein
MTVTGTPSFSMPLREAVAVPVRVVLGGRAQQDPVAVSALDQLADRRRGIGTAVDQRHGASLRGAADQAQRVVRRPVGSVGMALGRDHQRELARVAGAPLDLREQVGRRLGQVGDDEHLSGRGFGHAAIQLPSRDPRIIRIG